MCWMRSRKNIPSGKIGRLCRAETVCDRPVPFGSWMELLA